MGKRSILTDVARSGIIAGNGFHAQLEQQRHMSDGFPDPQSNPQDPPSPIPRDGPDLQSGPQYPPQPFPPYGPDPRNDPHRSGVRLGWAIWAVLFLLLLLIVPTLVEQIEYAYTRGKERAEAEVARQLLDEGREVTIGQYRTVVKAVQSSVVGVKASRRIGGQDDDELPFPFTARIPRTGPGFRRDRRCRGLPHHQLPRGPSRHGRERRIERRQQAAGPGRGHRSGSPIWPS